MNKLFDDRLDDAYAMGVGLDYIKQLIRESEPDGGMKWEMDVIKDSDEKVVMHFEHHKKRISDKGYSRAPFPQEVLNIVKAKYHGVLSDSLLPLYEDMFDGRGEFTNYAMQHINGCLRMTPYAHMMRWKDEKYEPPEIDGWYNTIQEFNTSGLKQNEFMSLHDINKVHSEITEYLLGVEYAGLPDSIVKKTMLFVPKHDLWFPMSIASGLCKTMIFPSDKQASRGVIVYD